MGLEQSRLSNLPIDIDSKFEQYRRTWRTAPYLANIGNIKQKSSTLSNHTLKLAGSYLSDFLHHCTFKTPI